MLDLAKARLADAQRALQNPNAHRLEVEDAMLVTLKKNNIPLSEDFIADSPFLSGPKCITDEAYSDQQREKRRHFRKIGRRELW